MKTIQGPKSRGLSGDYKDFRKDPVRFLFDLWHKYGDIAQFRIGSIRVYSLVHPDYVRHVLQTNNKNYGRDAYRNLKLILGNGLLTNEGDPWLRQRRLLQPLFLTKHTGTFADDIVDSAMKAIREWQKKPSGSSLNVETAMMDLTLGIITRTLFRSELDDIFPQIRDSINVINNFLKVRNGSLVPMPMFIPTQSNLRYQKAAKFFDEMIYGFIKDTREGKHKGSFLSILMSAKDKTGATMDDKQLRDELTTLFAAGHETTAYTLIWIFLMLSQNPHIENRLYQEICDVLRGRRVTLADLPNLPYAHKVICESLRLYPSTFMLARSVIEDDEIDGYLLKKNSFVVLSPYVTHRHYDFWQNPEGFYPERFSHANMKSKPKFAYFPFGGGPRKCIGSNFATMIAQLMLVTIMQKCKLSLFPGHPVVLDQFITLHLRHGMEMMLEHREVGKAAEQWQTTYSPVNLKQWTLQQSQLFNQLSQSAFSELLRSTKHLALQKGAEIIQEGDVADAMFVIVAGSVQIHTKTPKGDTMVLATLGEGDHFGEQAIISEDVRNASARAHTNVTLLRIDKATFQKAIRDNRAIQEQLQELGRKQLRENLIKQSQLFRQLEITGSEEVREKTLAPGEVLFSEGEQVSHVYVILSGTALVYREQDGQQVLVTKMEPGQCAGEQELLSRATRSETVIAETPLKVVELDAEAFLDLYEGSSEIRTNFQSLEHVYKLPGRGFITQHMGIFCEQEALTTIFHLTDGRRFIASHVAGQKLYNIELGDQNSESTIKTASYEDEARGIFREIRLSPRGTIRGLTSHDTWDDLPHLQTLILDAHVLSEQQLQEFTDTGRLVQQKATGQDVCTCLQISHEKLQECIQTGDDTIEKLQKSTNCGTVCGGCIAPVCNLLGGDGWTPANIASEIPLTRNIRSFRLVPGTGHIEKALPGQHITVQANIAGQWVQRSYILSAPANQKRGYYEITIKKEPHGTFSQWIFDQRQPDSAIRISSPQGSFFWKKNPRPLVCLVAGIGVVPALAVCRTVKAESFAYPVYLHYSARTQAEFVCVEEFAEFRKKISSFRFTLHTTSQQGRISQQQIDEIVQKYPDADFMVCGPSSYLRDVAEYLENSEVKPHDIQIESFTPERTPSPKTMQVLAYRPEEEKTAIGTAALYDAPCSLFRMIQPDTRPPLRLFAHWMRKFTAVKTNSDRDLLAFLAQAGLAGNSTVQIFDSEDPTPIIHEVLREVCHEIDIFSQDDNAKNTVLDGWTMITSIALRTLLRVSFSEICRQEITHLGADCKTALLTLLDHYYQGIAVNRKKFGKDAKTIQNAVKAMIEAVLREYHANDLNEQDLELPLVKVITGEKRSIDSLFALYFPALFAALADTAMAISLTICELPRNLPLRDSLLAEIDGFYQAHDKQPITPQQMQKRPITLALYCEVTEHNTSPQPREFHHERFLTGISAEMNYAEQGKKVLENANMPANKYNMAQFFVTIDSLFSRYAFDPVDLQRKTEFPANLAVKIRKRPQVDYCKADKA